MNIETAEIVLSYKDYLTVIQEKSPNTVYSYMSNISIFMDYLMKKNKYKEREINEEFIKLINLQDLYGFLSYLKNERNNSAYARARKIAAIKSFFKYFETKLKIINYNPCIELEMQKKPKKQINYLSLEESKELLTDVVSRNKQRDLAILTLFLNCGLRLNEICNIKVNDIKEDILVVRGKGDKDRTIYLNEVSLKALEGYMKEREHIKNSYLFLSERKNKISKRQVQYIVQKNILKANLDTKKYTVHKLRHTAATLLYKYSNVDIRTIQEILGHKNISTTTIYTHVDNEQVRSAIRSNPLNEM